MNVILVQQGDPRQISPQIPSRWAGLSGAPADVAYLKSIGVQFGLNGAGAMTEAQPELEVFPTLTLQLRSTVLEPVGAPDATIDGFRWKGQLHPENFTSASLDPAPSDVGWFCINAEPTQVVEAIRRYHAPSLSDPSIPVATTDGHVDLPYLKTTEAARSEAGKWRMTKKIMREVAARYPTIYEFNESSPSTLRDPITKVNKPPTYKHLNDAMIAVQVDLAAWIKGSSDGGPSWAGRIMNDWRHGLTTTPFDGTGWFVAPDGPPPATGWNTTYYRPQDAPMGATGIHGTTGTPYQYHRVVGTPPNLTVQPWDPGSVSIQKTYLNHVGESRQQALKTSENSASLWKGVDGISFSWYFELPTHSIQQIDPRVTTSGDHVEIGFGTGGHFGSSLLPRNQAREVLHAVARANWLSSWRHMGERTTLWLNGTLGFNYAVDSPFWGLTSTDAELRSMLDAMLAPLTALEIQANNNAAWTLDQIGAQVGDVPVMGSIVVWNAATTYLNGLFTNDVGNAHVTICTARVPVPFQSDPALLMNAGRANMIRRAAAANLGVTPDWNRATVFPSGGGPPTNPWYLALARMLTDDLRTRCKTVIDARNAAVLKGAVRASRLGST